MRAAACWSSSLCPAALVRAAKARKPGGRQHDPIGVGRALTGKLGNEAGAGVNSSRWYVRSIAPSLAISRNHSASDGTSTLGNPSFRTGAYRFLYSDAWKSAYM